MIDACVKKMIDYLLFSYKFLIIYPKGHLKFELFPNFFRATEFCNIIRDCSVKLVGLRCTVVITEKSNVDRQASALVLAPASFQTRKNSVNHSPLEWNRKVYCAYKKGRGTVLGRGVWETRTCGDEKA